MNGPGDYDPEDPSTWEGWRIIEDIINGVEDDEPSIRIGDIGDDFGEDVDPDYIEELPDFDDLDDLLDIYDEDFDVDTSSTASYSGEEE